MHEKVIEYYNETQIDYEWFWGLKRYRSIHYGFYDANHTSHGKAVINFNRILGDIASIRKNDKVLDAGCGIGGSSLWLAKNIECDVTGISITPGQIKKAQTLASKDGLTQRAKFFIQDYNHTTFSEETFDVVWGMESICYAKSKKDFMQEAWRILKPNGRLVVADFFLNREPASKKERHDMLVWFEGWAMPNLASSEEFRKNLETVGFKNITFKNINTHILPSSKRMRLLTIIVYPFAKIIQLLGLRTETQMKNMRAAFYQYACLKKGLWTYGIFYAEKNDY